MIVDYAYSFCDAMTHMNIPLDTPYRHIHIGSTFCDQYFIHTSSAIWNQVLQLAQNKGARLSLVIPITGQFLLQNMKTKLTQLVGMFGDTLDEVIVNDFAMLEWIGKIFPHLSMWCGRLLVKDIRDPRLYSNSSSCNLLDFLYTGTLYNNEITGLELDSFAPIEFEYTPTVDIGIHRPYGYISTGRLCEIGSTGSNVSNKFRPNGTCSRQCDKHWIWYRKNEITMLKHGRAIYSTINENTVLSKLPKHTRIRIIQDGFAEKTDLRKEGGLKGACL